MNLSKLGPSSWIIFLNFILLIALVYILSTKHRDSFINYPQQVDPNAKPKSNPEANSVNNNYASILMYIQKNPSDSFNFIKDVKSKFFDDSCKVKSNIDFANIASMPSGLPFGND
jgi:hypothetical protein